MAGEWRTFRLGDVCSKIGSGATPRGGSGVYLEHGDIALIRSQNIYNDGFHHDGITYLTEEHAAELANVEVAEHDVLLNITGDSVARSCQVGDDVLPARVNQHVAIIRPDPATLWPRFLRYYLVSPVMQAEMLSLAGAGATRNALTKGMIESFEVPAPADVEEQRAIAHILGALDDKIELNRRMNETLEAMARALFNKFFPYAPDDELPKGWRTVSVGDEVRLTKGVSYRSEELAGSPTALVTLKSINRGGGYRRDGLKPYIGEFEPDQVIEPGELVVAYTDVTQAAEVIGKPALVLPNERFKTLVASLDLSIVRPIAGDLSQHFFYLLFRSSDFQAHVYGYTNGTTVLHLSKTGVPSYRFARPPASIAQTFTANIRPIFKQIAINEMESRTLAALRDTLLPRLLSGEIRVSHSG